MTDAPETAQFPGNPDNIPWTLPGTTLRYGEQATVGLTFLDSSGVFQVTASISPGSESDWAALGLSTPPSPGAVPSYMELTLTQLAGSDFAGGRPQDRMLAAVGVADFAYPVELTGDNPLCVNSAAPAGYTVGSTMDVCIVVYTPDNKPVNSVYYIGTNAGSQSDYVGHPVIWHD